MCVVLQVSIQVTQSILLGYLTQSFVSTDNSTTTQTSYLYAMGIAITPFINLCLTGLAFFQGQKIGMILRVIATSAIYKKVYSYATS